MGTQQLKIENSEYKILITDDVISNVLLLKILLQTEKYKVITANSGPACIESAKRDRPDLILLDVMMPGMDGWETCIRLKQDPETAEIPVFFLTALTSSNDIVHGFEVGASDYVTKPINKQELLSRVAHEIQLVYARRMLAQKNAELQHTIAGRDKMYSVIAHDLRSPLGTVKMVLEMLGMTLPGELIGEDNAQLLSEVTKQTDELFSLLDNLLKWTKSQTGRLQVVYQNRFTNEFIPSIVELFDKVASVKGITLQFMQDESENICVHADIDMIKTVVRNFISNAIKFSTEGHTIDLYVKKYTGPLPYQEDADATPRTYAKIAVRDHGCGISEENQKKLFHKETHYTTYGTANEEGSGLGLMLCKDFAVKNGGDVMLESTLGEGSTFSILVPIADNTPGESLFQ